MGDGPEGARFETEERLLMRAQVMSWRRDTSNTVLRGVDACHSRGTVSSNLFTRSNGHLVVPAQGRPSQSALRPVALYALKRSPAAYSRHLSFTG